MTTSDPQASPPQPNSGDSDSGDPDSGQPTSGDPTSPASSRAPEDAAERKSARRTVLWVGLLLAILAALLCWFWPQPRNFDYFRAKAAELDNDRARVLSYVRDEVVELPYRGDVKGPLGALWEGAGSPEEKLALARAVLAHCSGAAPTLQDVAPQASGEAGATFQVRVVHRALLAEGQPKETEVYAGPIGALVGSVHSVAVVGSGSVEIVLRPSSPSGAVTRKVVNLQVPGLVGEELELSFESPAKESSEDAQKEEVVTRELWRRGNRVGLDSCAVGDRHDFVVWPCRVSPYVREKEELRLSEVGRLEGLSGQAYLTLLDFALGSDETLAKTEERLKVRARFDLPRVIFLSRVEVEGQVATAFDLRQDALTFTGGADAAWEAANARAWQEAELEDRFLREKLGVPVSSAWSLFQQLDDTAPNTPARRMQRISRVLARVLERQDVLSASFARAGTPAQVQATRSEGAVKLVGQGMDPTLAKELNEAEGLGLSFGADGSLSASFSADELGKAALAVEVTLLASAGELPTATSYLLDARLERQSSLVTANAAFVFETPGKRPRRHEVRVTEAESGLGLSYRVSEGLSVVKGTKRISAAALAGARRHNPWYRRGEHEVTDETSFCLSRAVFAELKAGQPAKLELLAQRKHVEDARAVAWAGHLVSQEAGQVEVVVNGRKEALRTLEVGLGERRVVVLDDPRFPIGLANRLTSISTGVRARVVDPKGVGFADVQVALGDLTLSTDVDGALVFPPPGPDQAPYSAEAEVRIWREIQAPEGPREVPLGSLSVDLSQAGLSVIELKIERPKVDVRRIAPDAAPELEALEVSEQVKRHARRALAQGRTVAIPARMVRTPFGERIAFFAHDQATGNLIGVSEDGLHGASGNWDQLRNEIQQELISRVSEKREDLMKDGVHPIHMIRGFIVAFTVYATYRLKGMSHDQTISRMVSEMEHWERSSNLFTNVPDWVSDTEAGGLVSKVGNANGPTSFYIGYLSALGYLHEELGR